MRSVHKSQLRSFAYFRRTVRTLANQDWPQLQHPEVCAPPYGHPTRRLATFGCQTHESSEVGNVKETVRQKVSAMKLTSHPSTEFQGGECHAATAAHDRSRPQNSVRLPGIGATRSIDRAIARDWLLAADRERRNARYRNGAPVRILAKPVKTARLSVAGLIVEIPSFIDAQEQFVRSYLRQVLTASGGNVSWAARLARRNRTGFHRLLVTYKLAAADFRSGRHSQETHDAAMSTTEAVSAAGMTFSI